MPNQTSRQQYFLIPCHFDVIASKSNINWNKMEHIYKIHVIVVNTESAAAIKEENKNWMYDWKKIYITF